MTQTEIIPSKETSQAANDAVFSSSTRIQALKILSDEHGGLIKALGDPARNLIGWILHRPVDPKDIANVIDARTRFNRAANDSIGLYSQESSKAV